MKKTMVVLHVAFAYLLTMESANSFVLPGFGVLRRSTANAYLPVLSSSNKSNAEDSEQDANGKVTSESPSFPMLVTFDLDDTLFPITPVVQDANEAQIREMHELGYKDTTIEGFMDCTRTLRRHLKPGESISYSDLRKWALSEEMKRQKPGGEGRDRIKSHADQCFDAWLNERHAASERYLFGDALGMLESLREQFSDNHLCIGAITNGRGNPLCMTSTVASYFDFCVSGEDEDVFPHRKPHPEIYQASLRRYQVWQQEQQQPDYDIDEDDMPVSRDRSEQPYLWFHVGDCLANDVGASSDCGAYAIWVAPEEDEEEDNKELPRWSTATEEEQARRAKLEQAAREKVSGRIQQLSELPTVIDEIVRMRATAQRVALEVASVLK